MRPSSQPAPTRAREPAAADAIAAVGAIDDLILDLLEWLGRDPQPYAEVLDVWKTSCPRLTVWEDANDRGFIARRRSPGRGALVGLSAAGAEHLCIHRRTLLGEVAHDPAPTAPAVADLPRTQPERDQRRVSK